MADDKREQIDGNSPQIYERGRLVAHCSDDSGIADCGISVGLGNGQMLYAGDLPDPFSTGIKLYSQGTSILVADRVDYEVARAMIEVIAEAINGESESEEAAEYRKQSEFKQMMRDVGMLNF